jgi:hypothetical protein
MHRLTSCAVVALLFCVPAAGSAQPAPSPRTIGDSIDGHLEWHAELRSTTEVSTLTFRDVEGRAAFTVEFQVNYRGPRPTTRPQTVDMIVTEHPANEARPQIVATIDGNNAVFTARPRTLRSVVVSMAFDDFTRLANADAVVQRAFDTDLEFGTGQLRMLRAIARRWAAP